MVTEEERGESLVQGDTLGRYWDLNQDQLSLEPVLTTTDDFQVMAQGLIFMFTSGWPEASQS